MTTFNIVLLLVVAAVVVTAYISNTFKVDKLMIRISGLEKEEQALLQEQENLRAEINILSSYDNIYRRAVDELHLVQSGRQPYQLVVKNLPEPEAARR
jgi:cell division protein FtsL